MGVAWGNRLLFVNERIAHYACLPDHRGIGPFVDEKTEYVGAGVMADHIKIVLSPDDIPQVNIGRENTLTVKIGAGQYLGRGG